MNCSPQADLRTLIAAFILLPICLPAGAQVQLNRVEYYLDTDPGYGQATAVAFTPDTALKNIPVSLDPTTLTEGVHIFGIRARDAAGAWSHDNTLLFIKPYAAAIAAGPVPPIVRVEYYVDADPGYGMGTPVTFTPGTEIQNIAVNLDPTPLTNGVHIFGIRAQDSLGKWSHDNTYTFIRSAVAIATPDGPVPSINRVEYYLDTDPGYGMGTPVTFMPGTEIQNIAVNIDPTPLSDGVHLFGIRARDSLGKWSHDNTYAFFKSSFSAATPDGPVPAVTRVEYYVDTDPGYGQATAVVITPGTRLSTIALNFNPDTFAVGPHLFGIRAQDSLGKWSHDNIDSFDIPPPQITVTSQTKTVLCAGDTFSLTYMATRTYGAGNVFTAQLSDSAGNFATPVNLGAVTTTGSLPIGATLPAHMPTSTGYRVRVVSSNPVVTGFASDSAFTIYNQPFAQFITGDSNVNRAFAYGYSLPAVPTSTFQWIAPAATITATGSSANITWNTVGQPQSLEVVETSQFGCIGDTSIKAVNVYELKIDTATISSLAPCPDETVTVTANVSGVYNAGNVFTAQLSDAAGSFAAPVTIGSDTASPISNPTAFAVVSRLPFPLANGTGYRVRIVSSDPAVTGVQSAQDIVIDKPNLGNDTAVTKCPGFTFDLTALYTDPALTYAWNTATPASAEVGSYTLVATNATGCKDTVVVSISNNPKPNLGNDTVVAKCVGFTFNLTTLYTDPALTYAWNTPNPTTADVGTYTIVATNASGCKDTAVVAVTNFPKPAIGADQTVSKCVGFTYNLTALYTNPALTYTWSTASPASANAGTYTVVATNSDGCKDTAVVTITNFPKPNLGANQTVSKCVGFTYDLTALYTDAALTYVWNTPTPATTGTGTFTVVATNSNGCKDTAVVTVTNFPKPALGADTTVTLSCSTTTFNLTTLYNTAGLTTNWSTANPAAAPAGSYTLTVTNANGCADTAGVTVNTQMLQTVASSGASTQTATNECTDASGWTHYYNNSGTPADIADDLLLLSIKKEGNNIGALTDPGFSLTTAATPGAGSGLADTVFNPLIPNSNGIYTMHRYWDVTPVTQPATPVLVRFYYNTADLTDVDGSFAGPLTHTTMEAYKLTGGNPNPTTNWAGATKITPMTSGPVADSTHWVYTNLGGGRHQCEMQVSSFSGGSMGITPSGVPLPVNLLHFTAALRGKEVEVQWLTTNDADVRRYAVQVSYDGSHFQTAGEIPGQQQAGSREYAFRHTPDANAQRVYYRLQIVPLSAQTQWSKTVVVELPQGGGSTVSLYPNPATDKAVLSLNLDRAFKGSLSIYNLHGQLVVQQVLNLPKGSHLLPVNVSQWAAGLYEVTLKGSGLQQHLRLVKE